MVTFGETMLGLAAPSFRRLEVNVGGSELNVAVG